MTGKLCSKCETYPRLSYGSMCEVCSSEYTKLRWASRTEEERETIREGQRIWNANNKEKLRDKALERKYGLSRDEFEDLAESQQFLCKICGFDTDKFFVDHDHITGKVRGLLCHNCNTLLGHAKDNPQILQSAISYLKESNVG